LSSSVRFRITAIAGGAFLVVLIAAGLLLLRVQERQLTDQLDATLAQRADAIVALAPAAGSEPVVLANLADDDYVVRFTTRDGEPLAVTTNAAAVGTLVDGPAGFGGDDVMRTVDGLPIDDDEFRVLTRLVERPDGDAVLVVAASTDDVRDALGDLRRSLLLVVPLATLALVAVVWWLVGRTLRPVEAIRREVAELELDDLDHRVPVRGTGDEIDRLATTMNDMLSRLDDASGRQRRFVADASHELRSPLARMRTELDVASAGSTGDPPIDPAIRRSLVEEVDSMGALVDDLLHLARSDAAQRAPVRRSVDLDDLVLQELATIRERDDVTIDVRGVSAANVLGDPGELRRVVRNLGDNAVRHARRRVEVTLGERRGDARAEAVLTVADDGEGIPPDLVESVFDRFTRLDEARTRDAGGTGLGLAIARDIVERHGGTIRVDPDHRSGARFVVVLPTG